jgi:trehalose 6-phosphate synthase
MPALGGVAIIVNPHDRNGIAQAILTLLDMPADERKEQWTAMMATPRTNDIEAWRKRLVAALAPTGAVR